MFSTFISISKKVKSNKSLDQDFEDCIVEDLNINGFQRLFHIDSMMMIMMM